MSIVIKSENISKLYRLGILSTKTISQDLNRFLARVRGKDDPYLKVGEVNNRDSKSKGNFVWALKDINFEISEGDITGIVGKNGAGKSTLLKILSRVTTPTSGNIKIKGRVASLLEVGTGFHQDLTGLENIYLNGTILGMKKDEIKRKLDEIVEFSGVGKYIDTPVKRYSSGMYVRLAFAVAAHLEPEILIVDEVLAVGDIEFQNKCLGKMKEVSEKQGRTVLFVSHNLSAMENLCKKGLLLSNGELVNDGSIKDIISNYLSLNKDRKNLTEGMEKRIGTGKLRISEIFYTDVNGNIKENFKIGEEISINIRYKCFKEVTNPHFVLTIYNDRGTAIVNVATWFNKDNTLNVKEDGFVTCSFKEINLNQGVFKINIGITDGKNSPELIDKVEMISQFSIIGGNPFNNGYLPSTGFLVYKPEWSFN